MGKNFDAVDIFFIVIISIYLITLLMFLFTLVDNELSKRKKNKKTLIKKDPILEKEKVIKAHPNNLVKNDHYKHNVSYLKNNPN